MIPSPRPAVQRLAPYVPGRPIEEVESEYGISGAVKLASNENPLGPSPRAVEAGLVALQEVHRYPDGSGTYLRRAISTRFGIPEDQVVLGSGASELIDSTIRAFVDPGDEVLVPEGIFRMFPVAVGRAGGTIVEVPTLEGYRPDIEAILKRVDDDTKVVAIANPNNPTGAWCTRPELERLLANLPPHVLTILDEAYFEFAQGVVSGYPDALDLLKAGHQVVVLRTFSKIYGLAGLRLGYAFTPVEVAVAINKVREPFNTTSVAQAAGIAALGDSEHRERTRALVLEERRFLVEALARFPVKVHPSIGNFLLVELSRVFAPLEPEMARRGVIVRPMGGWGFPRSFRLSVGSRKENLRFLEVFTEIERLGLLEAPGSPAVALGRA